MGSLIGPPSARSLASAIAALIGLFVAACIAFAAPADFSERDLLPPAKANRAAQPSKLRSPARRAQPTSYTDNRGASQQDLDEDEPDQSSAYEAAPAVTPAPSRASSRAPAAPPAARAESSPPVATDGDLSYVIHQGDSVGAVAGMFHLPTSEILRRNHLREDTMLHVGQVLRIPNPYAAQVRDLQKQLNVLRARGQQQDQRIREVSSKEGALNARITELTAVNQAVEHDLVTLPWWRRATMLAVTLATVMFGIAALSLVQWFLVRRRFMAVALANQKLSRLDQRYRATVARAELRLQQIYGRRRAPVESSTPIRGPEDFELDRLNRELKEVLEHQMTQMGVQIEAPARRSRFREWLANLGSPVAVRSDRR
jgi:LysM repeat protein